MKINKVLLIDDDPLTNYANQRMLEDTGIFTHIAQVNSGASALKTLSNCSPKSNQSDSLPDLIILDVKMPHMNGFEFLDHFEKLPIRTGHRVIICMLTASMNAKFRNLGYANKSIQAYMYKPLDIDELLSILEKHHPAFAA